MKDINFEKIGKKLRETRISKGLTQEYIAEKADVNTSHISNIENNRVKISLQTLVHVCNAMDITVDYILADEYKLSSSKPDALDHELLHQLQTCSPDTKECVLDIIKVLQKHSWFLILQKGFRLLGNPFPLLLIFLYILWYVWGDIIKTDERIRQSRKNIGITQKELGNLVGMSYQQIEQYP